MASTTLRKLAHWGLTWTHRALDASKEIEAEAERLQKKAKSLKELVRCACKVAGVEYVFFGLGDGYHCYTAAPVTESSVDGDSLSAVDPDLYKQCLKKEFDIEKLMAEHPDVYAACQKDAFSPETFFTLATEEQKKQHVKTTVKRAGAERFDTAKNVVVEDVFDAKGKPLKYDGNGPINSGGRGIDVVGLSEPSIRAALLAQQASVFDAAIDKDTMQGPLLDYILDQRSREENPSEKLSVIKALVIAGFITEDELQQVLYNIVNGISNDYDALEKLAQERGANLGLVTVEAYMPEGEVYSAQVPEVRLVHPREQVSVCGIDDLVDVEVSDPAEAQSVLGEAAQDPSADDISKQL